MDDADFAEWYAAFHPRLANALLLVSGDRDAVAEAADEAFARALAAWRRVRAMANRDGWAYRVAVNVLRHRARRAHRERQVSFGPSADPEPSTVAVDVWAAVSGLPLRQREAIVLRYLIDLDEAEIARAMGVTRSTVSSALTDARRHLADVLAGDEEEAGR